MLALNWENLQGHCHLEHTIGLGLLTHKQENASLKIKTFRKRNELYFCVAVQLSQTN